MSRAQQPGTLPLQPSELAWTLATLQALTSRAPTGMLLDLTQGVLATAAFACKLAPDDQACQSDHRRAVSVLAKWPVSC